MDRSDIIHDMNAISSLLGGTAHLLRDKLSIEDAWLLENIVHSVEKINVLRDEWVGQNDELVYRNQEIAKDVPQSETHIPTSTHVPERRAR